MLEGRKAIRLEDWEVEKIGRSEGVKVRRLGGWKDRRREDKKVKRLRPGIPKEREGLVRR